MPPRVTHLVLQAYEAVKNKAGAEKEQKEKEKNEAEEKYEEKQQSVIRSQSGTP